jgi:hypothetical protein
MARMLERPERATRAYRGAGILGLALLLWSGPAFPMLWTLAAAWLLAWLAFELAARMRIERSRLRLTRSAALLAGLAVLAWSVLRFAPVGERFLLYEGLRGAWENTADRLRLERLPSVAPRSCCSACCACCRCAFPRRPPERGGTLARMTLTVPRRVPALPAAWLQDPGRRIGELLPVAVRR